MAKKNKIKDFTLPEIKRPSKNYLRHLNFLVQNINRNSNLQISGNVTQSQNRRGSKYYVKGGGGTTTTTTTSASIVYGTITESLSYADELSVGVDRYTVDIEDGDSGVDVGIWNSGFGGSDSTDLRRFVPWLLTGELHPILYYNTFYFFLSNSFLNVGDNTEKSISWNSELGIVQSVFA